MKLFPYAHATHPSWRMAVELVLAQLHSFQKNPDYATNPNLGVLYITDHYAGAAQEILEALKEALLDQLGLELVPSREPIEMLVVEKVK